MVKFWIWHHWRGKCETNKGEGGEGEKDYDDGKEWKGMKW